MSSSNGVTEILNNSKVDIGSGWMEFRNLSLDSLGFIFIGSDNQVIQELRLFFEGEEEIAEVLSEVKEQRDQPASRTSLSVLLEVSL